MVPTDVANRSLAEVLERSDRTSSDMQRHEGVPQDLLHIERVLSSSVPLKHTSDISNPLEFSSELWHDFRKSTPQAGALSMPSAPLRSGIDGEQRAERQVSICAIHGFKLPFIFEKLTKSVLMQFYWLERFHEHLERQSQQEKANRSNDSDD